MTGMLWCTQCGHCHQVSKVEVDAGDYEEGRACPCCLIGIIKIDWDKPETCKRSAVVENEQGKEK